MTVSVILRDLFKNLYSKFAFSVVFNKSILNDWHNFSFIYFSHRSLFFYHPEKNFSLLFSVVSVILFYLFIFSFFCLLP